ncbi:stationary phase survival protein SurE [Pedobacter sp. L105]|uniref:stationary phase survival protein SurE n=1 Tax=Pedobacter sp. L105 TaxID=1641871 RepID=UPI00131C7E34|nr:stationary phase survival protein SurE [Pedobacter sp. L105]
MIKRIQDSVWSGFGIGIFVPGALLAIVWFIMHRVAMLAKADLLLIGCIAVNALLLKYFFKVNQENTGRGVLSATFIWALLFFVYKISKP